jgi:hypothetical protein
MDAQIVPTSTLSDASSEHLQASHESVGLSVSFEAAKVGFAGPRYDVNDSDEDDEMGQDEMEHRRRHRKTKKHQIHQQ